MCLVFTFIINWIRILLWKTVSRQNTDTLLFFISQETADLLDPKHLQIFKSWSGELRLLPNLKLRKYIKSRLLEGTEESVCSDEMEEDEDDSNDDNDEENEEEANNMTW